MFNFIHRKKVLSLIRGSGIAVLFFCLFNPGMPSLVLAQGKSSEGLDRPIARVNDVVITARALNHAMEDRMPATGHRSLSDRRLRELLREELDKLIVTELLGQEAIHRGIKATSEEIQADFEKVKKRFQSEADFNRAIRNRGMNADDIRHVVKQYVLIRKFTQQEIRSKLSLSEEDLRKYYDGNKEKFQIPEQIRLRVLLIKVDPSGLSQDWEAARVKAEELMNRAKNGEVFESLVLQYSDDEATRRNGGDTGLTHKGRLPFRELESHAFSVEVGEVGDPVRSLYGYVIFKVEEKKPPRLLRFSELNQDLLRRERQSSLVNKRIGEVIADLRAKASITIY